MYRQCSEVLAADFHRFRLAKVVLGHSGLCLQIGIEMKEDADEPVTAGAES